MEALEQYCDDLCVSLERLHRAAVDKGEADRRRAALRATRKGPGLRFNVGDYVMVPSHGTSPNPAKHSKCMTGWQGPYEITACIDNNPAEFMVRLLGDTASKPVHWRKMRRLAGPDYEMAEAVKLSAQHDRQRFIIDQFVDWSINTDDEVDVRVRWRAHEQNEDEDTWEPLEQLCADVPVLVTKYVKQVDHHQLTAVHRRCMAAIAQARRERGA